MIVPLAGLLALLVWGLFGRTGTHQKGSWPIRMTPLNKYTHCDHKSSIRDLASTQNSLSVARDTGFFGGSDVTAGTFLGERSVLQLS